MKINSAYVTAFKQAIRDSGHDPSIFFDDTVAIDEVEFYQLCNKAAESINDPTFALRYGSALHLGTHGVLGNALMSCRTLRQAAEFLVRHNPVSTMEAHIHFAFDHDNAILSFTPGIELPAAPNFLPEVFFMAAINGISEMVGVELAGCRVEFAFEPTMPEEIYTRFIGLPVHFGAGVNRFIGPRDAVNLPLAAAGNEVADIYVRQCSKILIERSRSANCAARVRRILLNANNKITSEHAVAERLKMSARTLRRRLSDEKTSFREIFDELRRDMAMAYLSETRLPIAEIGLLLGFDDVANFRRSFRRWNGNSPQTYREQKIIDDKTNITGSLDSNATSPLSCS
ncbi:MAG: AraC family transcriptional regulator ligand-binding domain-containing protein [Parvibaculum sp.]|nr:AraC family transcriptional regulator ligand-binding domain-containing protein [Parvibaculum sp.]